jgi:hypothetical protein
MSSPLIPPNVKEARFDPGFLNSKRLLLLLVRLRGILALLAALLAALLLLAGLLVGLRRGLLGAGLVLVLIAHEKSLFEKGPKNDFSGTQSIWLRETALPV